MGLCRACLSMMLLLRRGRGPLDASCAHSTWFGWLGDQSMPMLLRPDSRNDLEAGTERKSRARRAAAANAEKKKKKTNNNRGPNLSDAGWMRVRHFPGFDLSRSPEKQRRGQIALP
jgi:hypothetical protein